MDASITLDMDDLRAVAAFAAECAAAALPIFAQAAPADSRPRLAIAAAWNFAGGGKRNKVLRDASWAAMRAAQDVGDPAAVQAARAAMAASSAAYLHPLANSTQVKHILGAAAHAARALELAAGDDPAVGAASIAAAAQHATPAMMALLRRFPPAPSGGGRVGELLRSLDTTLRTAS